MKKNILTSIGLTVFFAVAIISLTVISDSGTTSVHAFTGGSPGGKTNSPADGSSCTQCHSGTINSGSGVSTITSTILSSGYVPGQTYTITGSITQAAINKFGFEVTAEKDADNSKVGTFIITNATNTKTVGSSAATHKSAGTSGAASKSWSFDWTAPTAGTGDVTFYGAFNATNSNSSTSGDQVYSTSLSVIEAVPTGLAENLSVSSIKIYPNPVQTSFEISTNKNIDRVEIYNLEGKKMMLNQDQELYDVRELPSGIYFVQIESDGKVISKKIIKE